MNRILFLIVLLMVSAAWGQDPTRNNTRHEASPPPSDLTAAKRLLEAQYQLEVTQVRLTEAQAQVALAETQLKAARARFQVGEGQSDRVAAEEARLVSARARLQQNEADARRRQRELELLQQELHALRDDTERRRAALQALERELVEATRQVEAQEKQVRELQAASQRQRNDSLAQRKTEEELRTLTGKLALAREALNARRSRIQIARDGAGRSVSLEFPNLTPGIEIIHGLFAAAGVSYVTDASAAQIPHISIKLTEVPFEKALAIVAEALGVRYEIREGVYFIRIATPPLPLFGYEPGGAMPLGGIGDGGSAGVNAEFPPGIGGSGRGPGVGIAGYGGGEIAGSVGSGGMIGPARSRTGAAAPSRALGQYRALTPMTGARSKSQSAHASVPPPPATRAAAPSSPVPPPPPAAAPPAPEPHKRATFVCPHCKKQETILPAQQPRQGYWKFCPFCGKPVK